MVLPIAKTVEVRLCVTDYKCITRINYPSISGSQHLTCQAETKETKFCLRVIFADHLKTRNMINKDIVIEHEQELGKKGKRFYIKYQ